MLPKLILFAALFHTTLSCSCYTPDYPGMLCDNPSYNAVLVHVLSVVNEVDTSTRGRPLLPPWYQDFPDMFPEEEGLEEEEFEEGLSVADELARYGLADYWQPGLYDYIGGVVEVEVEVMKVWGFGPLRVGQKLQLWSSGNGAMCGAKRWLQQGTDRMFWTRKLKVGQLNEVGLCDFFHGMKADVLDKMNTDC